MAKLSRVNMFLHNFPDPKIYEYDTLSSEERWQDNFDVIIANPPFMSPKGGIIPHKKFRISANRAEVLFTDYIVEHLKPKGRAGIIVPEGIIFQSANAYKELRKMLVEDGLFAVVSLPAGVFNPYAGVKTSILLFDNSLAKQSKEILFVKIANDGYDLGAQRRPINKNDLPEAIQILNDWKTGKKTESKLAVWVEKSKIAESGDYNLSGDRYRTATNYTNAKWPMVELGEVCLLQRGLTYSTEELGAEGDGVPFYNLKSIKRESGASANDFKYFKGEIKDKHFVSKGDVLIALTDLTPTSELIGSPKLITDTEKAAFSADLAKVCLEDDRLLLTYLNNVLRSKNYRGYIVGFSNGANVKHLQVEGFLKYKIPLPPLEIQKQVVAELDGYQNIITGAKQIVTSWKPKIEIDPTWEKAKLGEVCGTTSGGTPLKAKIEYYENGNIPWLRSGEIAQGFVKESELFITEKGLKNSSANQQNCYR